jgi:hypothetical protein
MRIGSNNQVEVVDIYSGGMRKVNVNFYKKNKNRLVPTDEYWIKDPESGNTTVNEERVAEARNGGVVQEPEKSLDTEVEEAIKAQGFADAAQKLADKEKEDVVKIVKKRTTRKKTVIKKK